MKRISGRVWSLAAFALLPLHIVPAHALETASRIDLTRHPVGYLALLIFFVAYGFVAVEKAIQLRKSKPVMLAAGLIWALLGTVYAMHGESAALEIAAKHVILDYGELMLFLVVAITYVNTMQAARLRCAEKQTREHEALLPPAFLAGRGGLRLFSARSSTI